MAENETPMVPLAEARQAVSWINRRLGLLHMCYARMLVAELGEEKGRELIKKAIWDFGAKVGQEQIKRVEALGLEPTLENMSKGNDLSPIGFDIRQADVDGEPRFRAYNCQIGQAWLDYGEEDLGGLYCLVDPSKTQAYAPGWELLHIRKITDGSPYCELAMRHVGEGKSLQDR